MALDETLEIEVVYALPDEQAVVKLTVPAGTTVGEAVERSRLAPRAPTSEAPLCVGVFGKVVRADLLVHEGDRVEIYRPLVADPKQARRRRAAGKTPPRASDSSSG